MCAAITGEAVTTLGIAESSGATFCIILAGYALVVFTDLAVAIGISAAIASYACA
jgi:hypothetical protein